MQHNTDQRDPDSIVAQGRMMSPEEIAVQNKDQAEFILYPALGSLYAERAARLRHLAQGHPMQDYLLFVANLADAQHAAAQSVSGLSLPTTADIHQAIEANRPLLHVGHHGRDAQWLTVLRSLLTPLKHLHSGQPVARVIEQLLAKSDEDINRLADRLLNGYLHGLDLAQAQLVAAGLQVYFSRLVVDTHAAHAGKRPEPFGRLPGQTATCPCCGSRPVASITRIGAEQSGFRYVSCSLCATQWHVVRVKCVACDNTKDITYQSLQAADADDSGAPFKPGAVQAECCDQCGHYLKIVHMEKDQFVEPHADDLASLALDLLVAEQGNVRFGNNLMLLFGPPPDNADPGVH